MTARVDLHQHLWPERLIALLARRRTPPRLLRRGGEWCLRLPGEPDCAVDFADHDPARRAALAERDGLERVVVCLSSPLGIEALPAEESAPLVEAFHDGVLELGAPFGLWAAAPHHAAAGVSVPAGALVDGTAEPLLAWAEARDVPLLVHPGPAAAPPDVPAWWPALTDYVAQMQAAWHAFETRIRPQHPRLRVVFAMLAGLAPLHAERLAARGAAIAHDPHTFYDVSSYGPRAVDAMIRAVGIDQLVLGSDRPVSRRPSWDRSVPPPSPRSSAPTPRRCSVGRPPAAFSGRDQPTAWRWRRDAPRAGRARPGVRRAARALGAPRRPRPRAAALPRA